GDDGTDPLSVCPESFARYWSDLQGSCFTNDCRFMARACGSGVLHLWHLPQREPWWVIPVENDEWIRPVISRNSRFIAGVGYLLMEPPIPAVTSTVVRHIENSEPAGPELSVDGSIQVGEFINDDATLVLACGPKVRTRESIVSQDGTAGSVEFWDWHQGVRRIPPTPLPSEPRDMKWHEQANEAVVLCAGGHLVAVNAATGKVRQLFFRPTWNYEVTRFNEGDFGPGVVSISPDGRRLYACWSGEGTYVIDYQTGDELLKLKQPWATAIHECDGRILVSETDFGTQVYSLEDGRLLKTLNKAAYMRISPDGSRALTAGWRSLAVSIFDLATDELACPLIEPDDREILLGDFIPDTPYVIVGCSRLATSWIQIHDSRSGRAVSPKMQIPKTEVLRDLVVAPDGRYAAIMAAETGMIMLDLTSYHDVPGRGLPDADARLFAELTAGARIEGSRIVGLQDVEWIARWDDFHSRHPTFLKDQYQHADREELIRHHRLRKWLAEQNSSNFIGFHEEQLRKLKATDSSSDK
ncbi:MAG: WD40 repeat domain-containing protein, partial [Planctomycetaceae bacterium]|nr:WD40 repeat domain-containing protein [Planctomycetaceae bacterium]